MSKSRATDGLRRYKKQRPQPATASPFDTINTHILGKCGLSRGIVVMCDFVNEASSPTARRRISRPRVQDAGYEPDCKRRQ